MDPAPASGSGLKAAYSKFAHQNFGQHPKRWAAIFLATVVVAIVLLILWLVYLKKYNDCEDALKGSMTGGPPSNLLTGGNNPQWQNQMGNAGWGGSMQSTYQPGQARVWGASADGPHTMVEVPHLVQQCGAPVDRTAVGDANVLEDLQALDVGATTAKTMTDEALLRVMNGGASA